MDKKLFMKKTVLVAPMMDCTDRHDRYFLRLISKNVKLYTEMIVADTIINGDRDFHLKFNLLEKPLVLQIGGSHPKKLAHATKIAENLDYIGTLCVEFFIDIDDDLYVNSIKNRA